MQWAPSSVAHWAQQKLSAKFSLVVTDSFPWELSSQGFPFQDEKLQDTRETFWPKQLGSAPGAV